MNLPPIPGWTRDPASFRPAPHKAAGPRLKAGGTMNLKD